MDTLRIGILRVRSGKGQIHRWISREGTRIGDGRGERIVQEVGRVLLIV